MTAVPGDMEAGLAVSGEANGALLQWISTVPASCSCAEAEQPKTPERHGNRLWTVLVVLVPLI
ncbi:hypothetical protein [Nitrococcus mobilis]|uniref:Uncharacterized protein n=1 Tax=Nitrococcus mobilis Nb-231 TaxID=314278 RepID=A4BNI0_9GAMM|nr:hypothetical protein [Nitrococcus mobilis]EAR22779.1 hypothetical protein NB231_10013 [Nitrococcus mobilis Nb-231]